MITVFGSINVDLVCQVGRIPKPGETVLGEDYVAVAGGKGANQALAAARAGAQVRMVGAVGPDGFAKTALADLKQGGVDLSLTQQVARATGLAFIAVDPGAENAIVVSSGANREVRAAQMAGVTFGPEDTLLLQMEVSEDETFALARRAKAEGARVILSLAPFSPITSDRLQGLDLVIMNEQECLELALHFGLPAASGKDAAVALADAFRLTVIVTLGAAGALAVEATGSTHQVPTLKVKAVDTTGAGDCFAGVLAAGLDAGLPLKSALHQAAIAAALSCTKLGAQPSFPLRGELEAALVSKAP